MKRIVLILSAALAIASCDYRSLLRDRDTSLDFQILDVGDDFVYVQSTPGDDNTLYCGDVITVERYEQYMKSMSEDDFQKLAVDSLRRYYEEWKRNWPGNKNQYLADMNEHVFYVSTVDGYYVRLTPKTDYYVYGFCINPETHMPLGPVQKMKFTTLAAGSSSAGMDFDFMIDDRPEAFYYYVRPSRKGRICFSTYFSTVLKDSDYAAEPYNGDIRAYLKNWIEAMGEQTDWFLSIDISRYETILDLQEEEMYTIVACPYSNLGNGPLTTLHFKYKEGLKTKEYRHDEVIKP